MVLPILDPLIPINFFLLIVPCVFKGLSGFIQPKIWTFTTAELLISADTPRPASVQVLPDYPKTTIVPITASLFSRKQSAQQRDVVPL